MKVEVLESAEQATKAVAKKIDSLLESTMDPVLLFVSGGSSLKILDHIQNASDRLTVAVLDERFSNDPGVNNFFQLDETDFADRVNDAGGQFITSAPGDMDIEEFTRDWQGRIESWIKNNPRHKVFAIFGMGPDGHTAGIFPYPEDPEFFRTHFIDSDDLVVGYDVGEKNEYIDRVTTTPKLFEMIDYATLFACGENKREKLAQLLNDDAVRPNELPVSLIKRVKDVEVFTDIK